MVDGLLDHPKGMAATAMAVAHSRSLLDLDATVASFTGPSSRSTARTVITVRQLLAHEAGLAVIDVPLGLEILADVDRLGEVLGRASTELAARSAHGYHAHSLGWYESQLLRRVDPQGRTIGRFFSDEVAAPLGIEFHIGLPDGVPGNRLATLVGGRRRARSCTCTRCRRDSCLRSPTRAR